MASIAEETRVAEKINENQAKVDQLTRDWNNKWKETQKIMEVLYIFSLFWWICTKANVVCCSHSWWILYSVL